MGVKMIFSGVDFSPSAIGYVNTGVLKSSDFDNQTSGTTAMLRYWQKLPDTLDAGTYRVALKITGYSSPLASGVYAYAVRLVSDGTARTGDDLLINSNSTTVTTSDVSVSADLFLNTTNQYLYMNINTKTTSLSDVRIQVYIIGDDISMTSEIENLLSEI